MKISRLLFLVSTLILMAGCSLSPYGYIYHHTIQPLDTNMNRTTVMPGRAQADDIKHFSYDIIDIYWGSNGIGEVARKNGLTEIYFVDIETFRVLGIWEQEFIHVYGR